MYSRRVFTRSCSRRERKSGVNAAGRPSISARFFQPLGDLIEDRFGGDVLGLGLEVAQQPMAQCRHDRVVDVLVTDAHAASEKSIHLGAQDYGLRAAGAR